MNLWLVRCSVVVMATFIGGAIACQRGEPVKMDVETEKAMRRVPDNGILISAPGQEPVIIEPGSREVSALGGNLKFFHVFRDDIPLPAVSTSAQVASAGPMFMPRPGGLDFKWLVMLDPRGADQSLRTITRVQVEDVSGDVAAWLLDSAPEFREQSVIVQSPPVPFTKVAFPWMYSDETSVFVIRITLYGAQTEVLLQPILIGSSLKRKFRDRFGSL